MPRDRGEGRAEVTLTAVVPSGTSIRWTATWHKTLMGRLVHRKLQAVYREVVDALVVAADGRHASNRPVRSGIEARDETP